MTRANRRLLAIPLSPRASGAFVMAQRPTPVAEPLVDEIERAGCPGCATRGPWSHGELTFHSRPVPTLVRSAGGLKAVYDR